jgi:subtilase family serine protease
MVSATCPQCHILLVEANSSSITDLDTAEATAASLGASAISNSWGASENPFLELLFDGDYNLGNVTITAASGDSGYGTLWPAAIPHVVAVGGTHLSGVADHTRMDRDRLVRSRQRLYQRDQTVVAARHRLFSTDRGRRVRGG